MEHWLERDTAQWVHHEGLIRRPIAPWANAITTELHLAPEHGEGDKCWVWMDREKSGSIAAQSRIRQVFTRGRKEENVLFNDTLNTYKFSTKCIMRGSVLHPGYPWLYVCTYSQVSIQIAGFLSRYLNSPLPYVWHHITILLVILSLFAGPSLHISGIYVLESMNHWQDRGSIWGRGRIKKFYLTTHTTHFIYGYMASDIW